MATRDTPWPAGTPCWIDLTVTDFDEAAEFYSTLFGWSVTPGGSEMGRYAIATMDDRPVAGLAPQMDPNQALPGWITYLATDDVDATARKIHDAGGSVLMDPMDVLDEGRIALALDPGGALFGLWQARRHIGFGLFNVPGSVVWNENLSTEWELNKTFYGAVFGWRALPLPDIGATMWQLPGYAAHLDALDPSRAERHDTDGVPPGFGDAVGWLLGPTHPRPAGWVVTIAVDDTDGVVARAAAAGATVVAPPHYLGPTRLAVLDDPFGARLTVSHYRPG